ncbi:hypothetical protein Tco_1287941, partial [Tanacetum coccineum]
MNPQEKQQIAARDDKWVPFSKRVKISSTNIRLETIVPQKEETFQKVQGNDSYEFLLANKKCIVNAEVFMKILDICLRVEGLDFTEEYGLPILKTMLTEAIKQSESYQMFIKYSTRTVDVFEESEPELEPAKKKNSSKRRVKKKVTLSADDNIISDDPDAALELAKSISQTEVEEAEAARKVHATHARIVIESVPKSAKKKSGGRCASSLTPAEQEATDIMQALKERDPDVDKDITKEKVIIEWGDEQDSKHSDDDNDDVEKDDKDGDADDEGDHIGDTQDADDEDVKTESDEEDIYKYKIRVRKDKDEEMINSEVDDSNKGDEEIIDAVKVDAEKNSEVKDDAKKTELPPSSSSLSVDQILLEVKIQSEVPHTQSPSVLSVHVYVISKPTVPTPVQESPSTATTTTLPPPIVSTTPSVPQQTTTPIPTPTITIDAPTVTTVVPESNALTTVELRVAKLEKDVSELKTIDHSNKALAIL